MLLLYCIYICHLLFLSCPISFIVVSAEPCCLTGTKLWRSRLQFSSPTLYIFSVNIYYFLLLRLREGDVFKIQVTSCEVYCDNTPPFLQAVVCNADTWRSGLSSPCRPRAQGCRSWRRRFEIGIAPLSQLYVDADYEKECPHH